MRRAVVLAAGDGGRLGPHTHHLPKALVPVAGRPIIRYTLEALADSGVTEAVVVTGYREQQVLSALRQEAGLPRLRFVSNPEFRRGASLSLKAARPAVGDEPFVLVMADHLLSAGLLQTLIDRAHGDQPWVAADFRPEAYHDIHEATRLRAEGHPGGAPAVTAIGKHVEPFDALDTGAFALRPDVWEAADAVADDCDLSVIFSELVVRGTLCAADVSGHFWFDVDTEADLVQAEELVRARAARGVA